MLNLAKSGKIWQNLAKSGKIWGSDRPPGPLPRSGCDTAGSILVVQTRGLFMRPSLDGLVYNPSGLFLQA